MITNENIKTFKDYGFVLTRVGMDKKPETPDGTWKYDWTDEELLLSKRIGAYHKESNIVDVDFDDKDFIAHKFIDMLPPTLTIGKKVKGKLIPTHKIYKCNKDVKGYSFPKTVGKGGKIIELLTSTQTIIAGVDRVIINNIEPMSMDIADLNMHCRLIAAFSELYKHIPEGGKGLRNDFYLRLGGALAKETDVPMDLRLGYVEKLCDLTGDLEVKNRKSRIEYQQQQHDNNIETVLGIKSLSEFLGTNLKAFDEIKRVEEKTKAQGLEILNGNEFTLYNFPEPEYLLNPIIAKQQIRQVFAKAGTGKTLYCMHEAAAVASGEDFLHYKNKDKKKTPVLYVEGEMDSASIKKRLHAIEDSYEMQGKKLNKNYLFFATLAIQKNMHFESLTNEVGRLNVEITAKKIEEQTGIKPIIYLDNITALTVMQEKEGAEWVVMMQWLSKLRNKGYHVTFLHHPTKTGETASGSNIKERSIDIDMKLVTPDEKTLIEEYEEDHTQMTIEFLKWREHMNTFHSKKRTAIINRTTGRWLVFPQLTKTQRKIYNELLSGKLPQAIINPEKEGMSKANVYKTVKILKLEGLYEEPKSNY